jgi:hypothetical protein
MDLQGVPSKIVGTCVRCVEEFSTIELDELLWVIGVSANLDVVMLTDISGVMAVMDMQRFIDSFVITGDYPEFR